MKRSTLRAVCQLLMIASLVLSTMGTAVAQEEPPPEEPPEEEYAVLFFHLTTGFRHDSIPAAIAAVEELGAEHGFSVTATQDPTVFDDESLREYAAVVFFTDGENTLDHAQRTAFERYMHRGGGFVGLHSTSNMDTTDWPWWEDLLGGAFFASHPPTQDATLVVEDGEHPSTLHLPDTLEWANDEWYDFTANPRDGGAHILLTVDESTYEGGQMGDDHPIAWCNEFDGGRTFYTALGHYAFHYEQAALRQHILGGIQWAAGVADGDCGEAREGPPTEASFERVALDDNTANPMRLAVTNDGRLIYVELAGTVKVYDPDTQAVTQAAQIPVYRDQENGLLGIALAQDFDDTGHLYLFYSDPDEEQQHVSRFTFDDLSNTIDLDSEVVLLEIPHQRVECCHSSGDLDVGPDGALYISTGDDTNPFGSQNFAPIDYREGRDPWDAARTSGNTADLRGKILRIVPMDEPGDTPGLGSTYTVPDDNLFTEANDTYHDLFPDGAYDPDLALPEIFVMGLRNPFAIAVDQVTGDLWFGDVGPDSNPSGGHHPDRGPRGYDSWTRTSEASNYGWPFCYVSHEPYRQWDFATQTPGDWYDCEGGATNDSPRNDGLDQLPPATPRTLWYPYCPYTAEPPFPEVPGGNVDGGQNYGCGRSAFMGDVYNFDHEAEEPAEGAFPEIFDGKSFVMEWERDVLATIDVDDDGQYVEGSFEEFGHRWRFSDETRIRKPHDMQFGPDGSMYLIEWGDDFNFAGGGVNADSGLYRISYVKGGRTPVASASATPDSGQPDLEVSFSSEGSYDPDGEDVTYLWSFGDGTTSTEANPTHTYTEMGVFNAQLTVTDTTDRSSSSTVTITVGNTRPEVTIEFPEHGQVFDWGDEIPFLITVEDAEEGTTGDGDIDCSQVTVQRGLWHSSGGAAHVHPGPSQNTCEGTLTTQADADHGDDAHIATVVTASYTDDGGDVGVPLTGGTTHLLQPRLKQGHFTSEESDDLTRAPSGDTECCGDAIAGSDGAWAMYQPYHLGDVAQMRLRVASLDDTTIEVRRDAPDGPVLGTVDVAATAEVERVDGPDGFGSAVRLHPNGPNSFVDLPDDLVNDLEDFTISTWVHWNGSQTWARIFDFGTNTSNYMFLTPAAAGAGLRYAITTGSGEQMINAPSALPTDGWQHVAVTLSGTTGTLYLNGEAVGTNTNMTLSPSDLGSTDQNWIGESQWGADPILDGAVDDFQIHDRALTADEVAALMEPPGADASGGNVAWYRFEEAGGARADDSSGQGNHGTIVQAAGAATYTDVHVDLEPTNETLELYLVFPGAEARVNFLEMLTAAEPEPPSIEVTLDPAEPDGQDGWYTASVLGTLSSDDPEAHLEWRVAGGDDWTAWAEPVAFDQDGEHEIEARATGDGGSSEIVTVAFRIDATPPETLATVEGEQDGDVYVDAASVILTAQDATSGVATTEVRVDDGDTVVYDDPVVLAEPGEYTVEYRSIDVAGNAEDWQSLTVTVMVACTGTVVVAGIDSGVRERAVDLANCMADRIGPRSDHRNHGHFVDHVKAVADTLVDEGTITRAEARQVHTAGARSNTGGPR
ncbi:ThuA domain-containing protein [Egicoccus sp. AB-alg2]|uniref:ThuA domain-containing protein n=1 Tax=Egicoccus sp. AB-alg2 TaxID=3242693 RepID=UPI00359E46C8